MKLNVTVLVYKEPAQLESSVRRLCDFLAGWVTALGIFLGRVTLPYCIMLFSRAQVAGLLGIAVWALQLLIPQSGFRNLHWPMVLVGFCVGLAPASEYTARIVVVALPLSVAKALATELPIVNNFIWNGLWPFHAGIKRIFVDSRFVRFLRFRWQVCADN
jgi:hypothetical protein